MPGFDDIFDNVEKSKKLKEDVFASVHRGGDITIKSYVPFGILTGLPLLDLRIGRPGWPAGRCHEFYGLAGVGKTTLALHALAQAQKQGGGGVFVDTEKTWDEERAWDIEVDTKFNFRIADADSVEAGFRLVQEFSKAKIKHKTDKPFVIIIDSITGVSNEYMKDRTIGEEARVGQDARAIRTGMRMIIADLAEAKINLFMVNHAISTIASNKYAKQSIAAGGHAIKLLSTVRINLSHSAWIKNQEDPAERLGQEVSIELEKLKGSQNKRPRMKANLMGDIGFDTQTSLLEACIEANIIGHKKGSQEYTFGDISFAKRDWGSLVAERGGVDEMYKFFIETCIETGVMRPWGGGAPVG